MANAMAIETKGLSKRLGGRAVVTDVDLAVPRGSIYGFLGPNGAGKTTVMRLLVGLLSPETGTVALLGQDLTEQRIALLRRIGVFIETHGLYEHLSGRQNLRLACRLRGIGAADIDRVLAIVGMDHAADRPVRTYSLGMKQRTALARALLGEPELLLLDEPTNGLDPDGIIAMRELIRALPGQIGATVFLSSHLLGEVEEIADTIGLLREGRLVAQGPMAQFRAASTRLRIDVDRREEARGLLASMGLDVEDGEGGAALRVKPVQGPEIVSPSAINRALVERGIAVSLLRPEQSGLESLYREMMSAPGGAMKEYA